MQTVTITQWQFWLLLAAIYASPRISKRAGDIALLFCICAAIASIAWGLIR